MSVATHQTVHLSRGKHFSPSDGACVMELASMLAGETFSDHPRSVCPVIAAFLRVYNDRIGDDLRQDLYGLASLAVGTRACTAVRHRRIRMCTELVAEAQSEKRRGFWRLFGPRPICPGALNTADASGAAAAEVAARRAAREHGGHEAALAFVERLIAAGGEPAVAAPAVGAGAEGTLTM
jgi:hypothetical protein